MQKFYFNTGVGYHPNSPLLPFQVWINGIKHIEFFCEDVPENASFFFASNSPDDSKDINVICRPILDGGMSTKYAYFKIYK